MSGVLLFLEKSFELNIVLKQQIVSISILGALSGVFSSGFISDWMGRKKAIILASFFYLLSSLVSSYADSIYELMVGRFLAGIGVGITSVAIPLYLAEISPSKNRGAIVTFYQLSVTIGILVAYFTNWALSNTENWRAAFFIPFVITCFAGVFLFFIPGTIVKKTTYHQGMVKKGLLVAIFLPLFQQFTGINTIIYYGPIIFNLAGFSGLSSGLLATLGIGIVNVIATVFALFWIDRVGRKKLLIIGLFGMSISLIVLSIFFHVRLVTLVSVISFIIFFAIGLGPSVFVVISEIFPMKWRARGISIALFVSWLSNYLISSVFLSLIKGIGEMGVFALFAGISVLALLFVVFFIPETKGKVLE